MAQPISAQQPQPLIPRHVVPKPTFGKIPLVLHQFVLDFLLMQNIAQSVRLIRKGWEHETTNGHLNLNSTRISFPSLQNIIQHHFKNLFSFHSVHLGWCKQLDGDYACEVLQFLPSLTKLRLPSSTSDSGLGHFKEYKGRLNYLSLNCCHGVSDKGVEKLAEADFPLTYLDVQGSDISSQGIEFIAKFPLTNLNLSDCRQIDDDALKLLGGFPLTTLKLSHCYKITKTGTHYLSHLRLTRLWLSNCNYISDEGFGFLNKMPLRQLRLDRTPISGKTLYSLELLSLTDLDIGHCSQITDLSGLVRFPLETLSMSRFRWLDAQAVDTLVTLNITSLSIPWTNIEGPQFNRLSRLPLRYLNIRAMPPDFIMKGEYRHALLKFSKLTTLELSETVYTKRRETIAVAIGLYLEEEPLFQGEIPTSAFSLSVEMIQDAILEYLEPKRVLLIDDPGLF